MRPLFIKLIDTITNGFDLPEELRLVLLVEQQPVLDLGDDVKGMQPVDSLVEIDPDRIELLPEGDHVCQIVIFDALVVAVEADWFVERHAAHIVCKFLAGSRSEELLQCLVFGLAESGC